MRLVDLDDAVKALEQAYPNDGQMSCHDAVAVIGTVPTIEPRKKGKWIDEGQYADFFPHHAYRCSDYTAMFTVDAVERKDIEKAFEYLKNIEITGEMVMRIIGNIPTAKPDIIIEYPDWILDVQNAYATAVLSESKHPIEDALREAAEKNKGE